MTGRWVLAIVGTFLVSTALLSPRWSRGERAGLALVGGIILVTALNPGRQQHRDPSHRAYRP